ncbi:MAG: tyrosine-type recombinase/integrase [Afipia sp.]|nr:tyrosine-type recombinase/integrase [Afipia sp.]
MLVTAAVVEFLRYCAVERQLSKHTIEAYRFDLGDFIGFIGAGTTADAVGSSDLDAYLADMLERRALAPTTVRRRFACLKIFWRKLVSAKLAPDIFATWSLQLPRRKKLPRALSSWEARALLRTVHHGDLRFTSLDAMVSVAFRLMVATGIRVGELCRLRVIDISPDGKSLRIHGKGSRERVSYVSDVRLQNDLRHLIQWHQTGKSANGSLLLNRQRRPMSPQSIRIALRHRTTTAAFVRRITPHMLRHTAATLLIEQGVDIRFVQRLLGHSSIATTEIYTHVSDEALRRSLERANILSLLVA